MAPGSIPAIELTPLLQNGLDAPDSQPVLAALRDACAEIGFVTVTGHGVRAELIDEMVEAARAFFALPEREKLAVAARRWNAASPNVYRGYFPASAKGKEGLDIGDPRLGDGDPALLERPYYELNRFPEALGEDWQRTVERYFEALFGLGRTLVSALAASLGGDAGRTARAFARPESTSTLRFNFYPDPEGPVETSEEDGVALSCETHVDSGLITILYQDHKGGLQVRDRTRTWQQVPFDPQAFVVNTGLALQRMTGGALAATPHRVLLTPGERLSLPFFLEPAHDLAVDPASLGLPAAAEPGPSYERFLRDSLAKFAEYQRDG